MIVIVFFFFRKSSNRLDINFHSARFQAGEWRNDIRRVDEFMNVMSRMLNSNEQFELNDTFQLEFVHVRASPQGGVHGRDYKPGHQASTKYRLKKKCIVEIPRNEQNLCCARALVTAIAHVDNHPKWRSFQRGLTIPRRCGYRFTYRSPHGTRPLWNARAYSVCP